MNAANPSQLDAEDVLIDQASKGDLEAFNQLVLRYQDIAYHHANAMLGDAASADDVTQESFIKAFKNIRSFRGGSFRAWLLKIVTNTAYDLMRQSKQHLYQPLFPEDEDGEEIESPAWRGMASAVGGGADENGQFQSSGNPQWRALPERAADFQ